MIERGRMLNVLEVSTELRSFDEVPVLRAEIDPQVVLSRNDHDQPFFLALERDSVIVQMAGTAHLDLRLTTVSRFDLEPGDHVYVPARTPTRLRLASTEPSVNVRYKAQAASIEAAIWYCESCDTELFRYQFSTGDVVHQAGYLAACIAFNEDINAQRCGACSAEAQRVNLSRFRWDEFVETHEPVS